MTHEWMPYDDPVPEVGRTGAHVKIYLDDRCLTRNICTLSGEGRDHMYVSLYPLAMWLASSWWRLHHEVLPGSEKSPPHDWRMSHEMVAATMGFVWPSIMFSADDRNIQVWAQASQESDGDAVRFLKGLNRGIHVPREAFTQEVSSLIEGVITRLESVGCKAPELSEIWKLVLHDQNDPGERNRRRLEAVLGFDPEDCPPALVERAMELEKKIGAGSFSELVGAHNLESGNRLDAVHSLIQAEGIEGAPNELLDFSVDDTGKEPWRAAVSAARKLREKLGNHRDKIEDSDLQDLLGLPTKELKNRVSEGRLKASVAEPKDGRNMKFIPRKKHPMAQRFEFARFIGDYVRQAVRTSSAWLVSADLLTARQKFQRAFAAEFLCPIDSLVDYLGGDFSETAREDAAAHFLVSDKTVDTLLRNNGYLDTYERNFGMPYPLAA